MSASDHLRNAAIITGRRVNIDTRTRVNVWEDMSDAVDDILNAGEGFVNGSSQREDDRKDPWSGSVDFGSALETLRGGWAEHRDAVEAAVTAVQEDPSIESMVSARFGWQHAYAGDVCDIGRFVTGDPECMFAPTMVDAVQPDAVIRIVINGTASAAIRTDVLVRRGIMIAALVDTLHLLGRGVEVWWTCSTVHSGSTHGNLVRIKATDEPLDVDDLLFVAAHPSMLRRFGFALWECESPQTRKAQNFYESYGRPVDISREQLAECIGAPVHVLFGSISYGDDYTDPAAHVLAHLKGLDF